LPGVFPESTSSLTNFLSTISTSETAAYRTQPVAHVLLFSPQQLWGEGQLRRTTPVS
jgi:hypothetical protein